ATGVALPDDLTQLKPEVFDGLFRAGRFPARPKPADHPADHQPQEDECCRFHSLSLAEQNVNLRSTNRRDKRNANSYPQVCSAEEKSMSIRKMIALHPDVAGHVNQPLGDAAHHLMYCARMCVSCADACAAEKMDMRQCIRVCLDCSDVCEATGKLAVRRTGANEQVLREMLELCARVCDECAAECEK